MPDERASDSRREETTTAGRTGEVMNELGRETDGEILEILAADSPLSVVDIARIADSHPITVDQTCIRLQEQGRIQLVGQGLYDVTEDGQPRGMERTDP